MLAQVDRTLRTLSRRWARMYALEADDVLQDARAIVLAHAGEYDPGRSADPGGWAMTLALGALRDGMRSGVREQEGRRGWLAASAPGSNSLAGVLDRETAEQVVAALSVIPADQARVIRRLFGIGGPPAGGVQAVAREQGCHDSTVTRQLDAALSSLRGVLTA